MVAKDGGNGSVMMHWNVSDFAALAGGVVLGCDASMPNRILSDSRDVMPGDAFIALPGAQLDGHTFLEDAAKRGAKVLIGSNEDMLDKFEKTHTCLVIQNIENNIISAAEQYINIVNPITISVTGSVGKTTTRECIYNVLSKDFKVHRPFRSYNTNIGCALTILSMSFDTKILVLEMGANHENEIASMVSVFPPDIAVITEAAAAHLEGFKSIEAILSTKCEIYKNNKTKILFYNSDRIELHNKIFSDSRQIKKYGVGFENSVYKILAPKFSIDDYKPKLCFILKTKKEEYTINSKFVGRHNVYPISFALAIGEYCGVQKQSMLESIFKMEPLDGRGVFTFLKCGAVIIDDSYNANPISMNAAINTLRQINTNGKKIAILGEMKELGSESIKYHNILLNEAVFCDVIMLYGNIWRNENIDLKVFMEKGALILCQTLEQCYESAAKYLKNGNIILIKGSHSNNLEFIVSKIKEEY